jgi:DNA replication protein DnaC
MQAEGEIKSEPCPGCGGNGWELVAGKGVRPCDCVRVRRIETALASSRIPERFRDSSFENYEAKTPSLARAVAATKRFIGDAPLTELGLLYLGSCGLGKTHLSCVALTALIRKGLSGLFYDFRDLLKAIQDTYNPNTRASELQVLAPILNADVLVLDELGAAKPTEWVQETVTHVVNTRYNEKRLTVFTSNYPDTVSSTYDETLTARVGVRLRSRLHEMCRLVPMEGEDYRLKIRNRKIAPSGAG